LVLDEGGEFKAGKSLGDWSKRAAFAFGEARPRWLYFTILSKTLKELPNGAFL
tara:strand:- start:356 stop:514 length:159 start_codon:yes stop_codon:yes gene_type:complete